MTRTETIRAYAAEPILAGLAVSLLVNFYGQQANAAFMHDEARDILSLGVVLLGAALALWIGLFWISSSDFGKWLASKQMLEPANISYIASAVVLLSDCVLCIICAHTPATNAWLQITGEFLSLWSLASIATLLNNTRHLLKLQGLYGRMPKAIPEIRTSAK